MLPERGPRTRSGARLIFRRTIRGWSALFGGAAPLYMTALIELTGSKLMPSFYLIVTALLSLAVLIITREVLHLR